MKSQSAPKILSRTPRIFSAVAGFAGLVTCVWMQLRQFPLSYSLGPWWESVSFSFLLMLAIVSCVAGTVMITAEVKVPLLWAISSLLGITALVYVVLQVMHRMHPIFGAEWRILTSVYFPLLFVWMLIFVLSSKAQPYILIGTKYWGVVIAISGLIGVASMEATRVASYYYRPLFELITYFLFSITFSLLPIWWAIVGVRRAE